MHILYRPLYNVGVEVKDTTILDRTICQPNTSGTRTIFYFEVRKSFVQRVGAPRLQLSHVEGVVVQDSDSVCRLRGTRWMGRSTDQSRTNLSAREVV
jgi:hypothetical protein